MASWLALEDALDPVMLTVMAQALPPNDTGEELIWDTVMPREDVDSVTLQSVTTLDYRPTADRREWNASGRLIPAPTPARRTVNIVPIEARDRINELEMQRMRESASGNAAIIRELIGVSVQQRNERLVQADYRRLEVDAVTAWLSGTIVQRNPENAAQTYTASFGFDTARLNTALTAWNDPGVNAYDLLLAWIDAAEAYVGEIGAAMTRRAVISAILADAPQLPNAVVMTRSLLNDRISDDLGRPFQLIENEKSVDIFDDGGLTYTRTKVWTAGYIAAIPTDGMIGKTAFAPNTRAMHLSSQVPSAGIDIRGVTVYHFEANNGKELHLEAQLNAVPVPDEQRVYRTDTGVT